LKELSEALNMASEKLSM